MSATAVLPEPTSTSARLAGQDRAFGDFRGETRTVVDILTLEAGLPAEVAQAVEHGLHLQTEFHVALAQQLGDSSRTGAPSIWNGFNGEVGELWRLVGSIGEQLMLSRFIQRDTVETEMWAEKLFRSSDNFLAQIGNFLGGKPAKMVTRWYQEIIDSDPVVASILAAQDARAWSDQGAPSGAMRLLAHGLLRPLLFGDGTQFMNSTAVRATGRAIDAVAGHEIPENVAPLTLVALTSAEIERIEQILAYAYERCAANAATVVPAQPLRLPVAAISHPVIRDPFFVAPEFGRICTAVDTGETGTFVVTENGLLEIPDAGARDRWMNQREIGLIKFSPVGGGDPQMIMDRSCLSPNASNLITRIHSDQHALWFTEIGDALHQIYGDVTIKTPEVEGRGVRFQNSVAWNEAGTALAMASDECPRIFITHISRHGPPKVVNLKLNRVVDDAEWLEAWQYSTRPESMMFSAAGDILAVVSNHQPDHQNGFRGIHIYDAYTGRALISDSRDYLVDFMHGRRLNDEAAHGDRFQHVLVNAEDTIFVLDGAGQVTAMFGPPTGQGGVQEWGELDITVSNPGYARTNFVASPNRRHFACLTNDSQQCEIYNSRTFELEQVFSVQPRGNDAPRRILDINFDYASSQVLLVDEQSVIWKANIVS